MRKRLEIDVNENVPSIHLGQELHVIKHKRKTGRWAGRIPIEVTYKNKKKAGFKRYFAHVENWIG